ncbi:DUF3078 domain-containing protein [Flavobacterium piscinae]|uniref:DUF3078 domain-containing protein n=1 Tax=Flavobacterium piscinae TaxID=2506424 RepID=UPI002AABB8E3|nr:DUF3078 domain-containing protein [Flavobacterium piscinae]
MKGDFSRKYVRGNVIWNNEMSLRYGVNKQEGRELRKTDDAFSLLSNYGYKKTPFQTGIILPDLVSIHSLRMDMPIRILRILYQDYLLRHIFFWELVQNITGRN